MEEKKEDKDFHFTGAGILHKLSVFCLEWSYDDFMQIFEGTEKGSEYYRELFQKVRLTFPETGADMLGFIYELNDEEKTVLFKHLFLRDVKF